VTDASSRERVLVARYLHAREEDAFRELYRASTPAVYGFLVRLTGKPDVAQELLQETWLRAATKLAGFRFDSTLATWLRGIALRCWHETRRAAREAPLPEQDEDDASSSPPPSASAVDLASAVAALPDLYRTTIVLHDVAGYTHDEIAAQLGIDAGTSRSRLSRARERLRRTLSGRGDDS
jgi:RNA polymerase sigma-70 factor (ECF subfamily)